MNRVLTRELTDDVLLRLIRPDDAASYCEAQVRSREQLKPWEPRRDEQWYDVGYQTDRIRRQLERDNTMPFVLVRGDAVIGTLTLSNIVPGPWQSADLGYWVAVTEVGKGLASAAVAAVCELADTELWLHRIAAGVRTENAASQRVLTKNGFEQYGVARDYLHIDGAWRDHVLYQRILNTRSPGEPPAAHPEEPGRNR